MKTLIINRFSEKTVNYENCLLDIQVKDLDFIFVTRAKHIDVAKEVFCNRIILDDFNDGKLESEILKSHMEKPIDKIIATHEYDIEKSGYLREILGIKGQGFLSSISFRNKFLMKNIACRVVDVPKYALANCVDDILEFRLKCDNDIVVKPLDEAASLGVIRIEKHTSINDISTQFKFPLLVEEYIIGKMYHCDGFFKEGELKFFSVGEYINGCLSHIDKAYGGSILENYCSDVYNQMKAQTKTLLAQFPIPESGIVFHAEFFYTSDNKIIFCEVASRHGGGKINETIEKKYGINILNEYIKCQMYENYYFPEQKEVTPLVYGFLLVPPKCGRLVSFNDNIPFDFVDSSYFRYEKIGVQFNGASNSVEEYASVIVFGNTKEEVQKNIQEVNDWVINNTVWKDE